MAAQRYIRNFSKSTKFNRLNAPQERLCLRLFLAADDYGNFPAKSEIIKAECFPLKSDIRLTEIGFDLLALASGTNPIIRFYEADDKAYIHILEFGQAAKMRWPKRLYPPCPFELLKEKSSKKEKETEVEAEVEVVVKPIEKQLNDVIDMKNECFNYCIVNYKRFFPAATAVFRNKALIAAPEALDELFKSIVHPAIQKELELFWAYNDTKNVPVADRYKALRLWLLRKKN